MPLPALAYAAIVAVGAGAVGLFVSKKKDVRGKDAPPAVPKAVPSNTPPGVPPKVFINPPPALLVPMKPGDPPPPPPKVPNTYVAPPVIPPPPNAVQVAPVSVVGTPSRWQPGPMPNLPAASAAAKSKTVEHSGGQTHLVRWLEQVRYGGLGDETAMLPALKGKPYTLADVTGVTDERTRAVLWLFQRYFNSILLPEKTLAEDGLFGPASYAALSTY